MSASIHQAAWLTGKQVRPLRIGQATTPALQPDQVLVRVRAVAVNPIDWMLQSDAFMDLPYPFVLGMDAAGEIEAVGSAVTRFKKGDRVLGQSVLLLTQNTSEGTFQEVTVMYENLVSKIPDSLSFEKASVIPLGFSTAACGMFLDDYLGLRLPNNKANKAKDQGCLIIWGGASSVGLNAIQLAVASGYEVVATASLNNASLLKSLGVTSVFDYRSTTIVEDLLSATRGKRIVGAFDCVSKANSTKSLASLLSKSNESTTDRFIATVLPAPEDLSDGVSAKYVHGVALRGNKAVSKALYGEFLPLALSEGTFLPLPEPQVVGHGLESIQEAMDIQRAGVSAKKVVVTL